mmetsp:Transcript_13323/g.23381  ORF Transcript_13323/g.23381 Transcript_13323/m.23381 type:complete len:558 (-) Transcript_13323:265-1938(-)|eukprot:CAMPEP_0184978818 /NCGR_PEP_ID=MMETSP1098-20130426/9222_1 /TAXON_ID=89044 /ORGANISM="Spumella elongata, Strain CCAP 955/1" /LENGTH=557 /DNA_ID=CAMNT_0027502017 /DNA_START=159 /DNA_END=1832 /DNA_ORIENTATION=-
MFSNCVVVSYLLFALIGSVYSLEASVGVSGTSLFQSFGDIVPRQDAQVYRNLDFETIYEHEIADGNIVASSGAVAIDTGRFTGRSPKDKYFVDRAPSTDNIWWGSVNKKMSPETFTKLKGLVVNHFNKASKIYVFDGYAGSSPVSRQRVRFISEIPWQHHFVTNMFIRPTSPEELENFEPDFTIINAAAVSNPDWKEDGLNSEVFVGFDIENKLAIIGGTYYGGEMKKGIFSMMNYWLPLQGTMSMHCSANIGKAGDTALYFGLSGTGKTTLSTDPDRQLIGDDEHGWDDHGVFNFEGGCYAKTIDLSEATEPEIFRAIRRDALLENVVIDPETKVVDFHDTSKTENGRVSYPIYHIPNFKPDTMGAHPKTVFFLTCDAFGVLPPISKLSPEQAMYHFLSGYTAKVAGTELGVTEPTATFSACFGAAFMVLHPTKYADLLKQKLLQHDTQVYLVNTGWSGGAYGVGKRMSIKATRACINSVLDGSINSAELRTDGRFGFQVPLALPGVAAAALNPEDSWADKAAFHATADKLSEMFKANYKKFVQPGMTDYTAYGPK